MSINARTIVFVLAGGKGDRLYPLTRIRAKPAVPFGGVHRIIDFTLSNCFNSGLQPAYVLTQHNGESLHDYLADRSGSRVQCLPPAAGQSYAGTADAVCQNLSLIDRHGAEYVLILAADHVYKMDYSRLLRFHYSMNAEVTLAAVEHPRRVANRFGILEVDAACRIVGFDEKPEDPKPIPGKPGASLVSMGIYVFNAATLRGALQRNAARIGSAHDFGRDIIPRLIRSHRTFAFRFDEGPHGAAPYWRDVGTIDAYHKAHMELLLVNSPFDSYDDARWPTCIFTQEASVSALVKSPSESRAEDSFVSPGASVDGRISHSVISTAVTVERSAEVYDSILMRGVHIARGSRLRRAIVEENVRIPENLAIGYDLDRDRRYFPVTQAGIVVIAAGARFPTSTCLALSITSITAHKDRLVRHHRVGGGRPATA